jgi:hypothetical protein
VPGLADDRTLVQLENPSLASTLSLTNFPLSEPSAWLLEEFAERHLIPPFYTKLAYAPYHRVSCVSCVSCVMCALTMGDGTGT